MPVEQKDSNNIFNFQKPLYSSQCSDEESKDLIRNLSKDFNVPYSRFPSPFKSNYQQKSGELEQQEEEKFNLHTDFSPIKKNKYLSGTPLM